MKKVLIILPALLFTLILTRCNKTPTCESPRNVNQSSINIIFKDRSTGRYLYTEFTPLYNKDSLKVFDAAGNSLFLLYSQNLIPNTSNAYWVINFGNIYIQQMDANSFNTETCKNYIIKYSYNEFDTVQVCFKSKNIECGSVFEILKIYHKGQLLTTTTNDTFAEITIIKN